MRGFISPALVTRNHDTTALITRRPVSHTIERYRFALVFLLTLESRDHARVIRGLVEVCARALATLPLLTESTSQNARERAHRLHDLIESLPRHDRVPAILACALECVQTAPFARDLSAPCPWRDVVAAVRSAADHGDVGMTERHHEIAERIVAEVLR